MSWTAIIVITIVFIIINRAQNNVADKIDDLIIRVEDLEDKIQGSNNRDDYEYYADDDINEENFIENDNITNKK